MNSHFTKDTAEAFIRRKQHDYGEMRIYVESQYYDWKFEVKVTVHPAGCPREQRANVAPSRVNY
jgi:hypothetical protein